MSFAAKIAKYIRKQGLIAPGERIGVAVSAGADSVALLRALVELRGELGCVLAVVHFNHKIRADADSDAEFVERLAQEHGLEFFGGQGDAKKFALEHRLSLETAGRELRYKFFFSLALDKIATAHTLDDQAETVLMKVLRGAGTKGLSGIWPAKQYPLSTQKSRAHEDVRAYTSSIIRPMLEVRRREVEEYLRALEQEWREDSTNRDVKHTRNKVRHELLPLLEAEYNPNIYQQLADAAEVARAEEEYWAEEIKRQEAGGGGQEKQHSAFSVQHSEKQVSRSARDDNQSQTQDPSTREKRSLGMPGGAGDGGSKIVAKVSGAADEGVRAQTKSIHTDSNGSETGHAPSLRGDFRLPATLKFDLGLLLVRPLAVRRRVLRQVFEEASGKTLDFEHTDALVRFVQRQESSRLQLPEYWFAVLDWPRRALSFEEREPARNAGTGVNGKTSKP